MEWPDAIEESLPAPRDDEPASLRRDIADELSDHLACALDRERRQSQDEETSKSMALQQFGNPSQIARRLWWDAMKERIMTQRMSLFAAAMAAVASIVVCCMAWQIADQSRTTNLALLEQSRDVNRELLNKLAAIPSTAASTQSLEWTPLKVRLVSGTKGGPPASGFEVKIYMPHSEHPKPSARYERKETTGTDGIVDLGLLRTDTYDLEITSPWQQHFNRTISLHAGEPNEVEIICPAVMPEEVEVTLRVDWPDDLREKGLWLLYSLQRSELKIDGEHWALYDGREHWGGIVMADSGQLIKSKRNGEWHTLLDFNHYSEDVDPRSQSIEYCALDRSKTVTRKTLHCANLPYHLTDLKVVEPPTSAGEPTREMLKVLGQVNLEEGLQRLEQLPTFRPTADGNPEWVIKLPEQLIEQVRHNLSRTTDESSEL